jgi:hypothetical protein
MEGDVTSIEFEPEHAVRKIRSAHVANGRARIAVEPGASALPYNEGSPSSPLLCRISEHHIRSFRATLQEIF